MGKSAVMGCLRTCICLLLLLVQWACTAAPPLPEYAFQDFPKPVRAPLMPPVCGDGPVGEELLLVFSAKHCRHCRALLADLDANSAVLKARGIDVVVLVAGVEDCGEGPNLRHGRRERPWAPAGPAVVREWVVETEPTTYRISRGRVLWRLVGRAPPGEILGRE